MHDAHDSCGVHFLHSNTHKTVDERITENKNNIIVITIKCKTSLIYESFSTTMRIYNDAIQ